jgi:cobalt-zinc-cadmium efflux system protein
MAHNHSHQRESNIALVFFINLAFTLVELVGGFLTNSVAVMSNAIHDSGDAMALGLSWYLERVAKRKRDRVFSFGYKRFSLLAALINSLVLLGGTVFILLEAIPRLFSPEPVNVHGMIGLAILGVVVNGLAALRLRKGRSMNETVMTLHLVEDVLGWVAVLIVAFVMTLGDFPFLDPILSLLFTCVILWNAFGRIKKTLMIFLQSIPDDVDIAQIEAELLKYDGVVELHDTHVWSLDGEHHVLSTHVVIEKQFTPAEIDTLKSQIRMRLVDFEIQHATIEVDYEGNSCEFDANHHGAH